MTDHHLVHPDFEVRYGEGDVWMNFPSGATCKMECSGHEPDAGRTPLPLERWDEETLEKIAWLETADLSPLEGMEIRQGMTIGDPEPMRRQLLHDLVAYGPCTATRGAVAQLNRIYDELTE